MMTVHDITAGSAPWPRCSPAILMTNDRIDSLAGRVAALESRAHDDLSFFDSMTQRARSTEQLAR